MTSGATAARRIVPVRDRFKDFTNKLICDTATHTWEVFWMAPSVPRQSA